MALVDLIQDEAGELCGLAVTAEVHSTEVARFFGNQEGEDEPMLETLEQKYQSSRGSKGEK